MRSMLLSLAFAAMAFPVAAAPAKWVVDPAQSSIGFDVTVSGQAVKGTFRTFTADIAFDPADLAHSKAVVTIDLASVQSGDAARDGMLGATQWFSTKAFPAARFETSAIKSTGGNAYEAAGTLTLRGVAKPLTVPMTIAITGTTAHATGRATIRRGDFGVGQGKISSGGETIDLAAPSTAANEVAVTVSLTATRTP